MTRYTAVPIVFLALLLGFAGFVLLAQRSILFPRPVQFTRPSRGPAEVVPLSEGGGLFLDPGTSGRGRAPLLIFLHGNGETADLWVDDFALPRKRGWAVLLVEYPGYGGTPGSPSERSIVTTSLAAYDWAIHDSRIDSSRMVIYGRSLGGGAATQLAIRRPVAALVLESAFTSVRPLAARFLVPGFLVRDPFDNLKALRDFRGPLLVMHGLRDDIVPPDQGRALAKAVPGSTFLPLPCGHNDCTRPWPEIFDWLDQAGVSAGE